MKHLMQPRNTVLREAQLNSDSPSSSSPIPKSKAPLLRKQKSSKENAPPPSDLTSPAPPPAKTMKSPLPPRPPNPLKRKLATDILHDNATSAAAASDSGVKVIVRMRPPNNEEEEGDMIVQKVTGDSVSINGQTFTFDSVADTGSTQAMNDLYFT